MAVGAGADAGAASRWTAIWLAVLALLTLVLRLWRADEFPPGLHLDEAVVGLTAAAILEGDLRAFYSEFGGREPLFMYAVAAFQSFMGHSAQTVRVVAVVAGTATVLATYWAFRELFLYGKWSNPALAQRIAWLAAAATFCSYWHLHLSREGYRVNMLPLLVALAVAMAWRTLRTRSWRWAAAAGICTGLSLYTYSAARFFPLVIAAFVTYLALRNGVLARKKATRSEWDPALLRLGKVWVGAALLAVAPLCVHFLFHPSDILQRPAQVSVFGAAGITLFDTLGETLRVFGIEGTGDLKYNLSGRPIFDPITSLFFYGGVVVSLWYLWRQPVYGFIFVWLVGMFLPATLSIQGNHPLRAYGAMPAVMGLWAIGASQVWWWVDERLRVGWKSLTPGLVLVSVGLCLLFANSYRDYFHRWASSAELYSAFDTEFVELASHLQSYGSEQEGRVVIATEYPFHPTVTYLATRTRDYHWVNLAQALVVPQGVERIEYILLDRVVASLGVPGNWYAPLGVEPAAERLFSGEGDILGKRYTFQLPQPISLESLGMTTRACGDSGVNFADDVTLVGYRIEGQANPGQPLAMTLFWHAKRPSQANYQIFVHLVRELDAGKRWGQQDANGAFSRAWQAGDVIIGRYSFEVDADAPRGEYLMQIGLYDLADRRHPRAPIVAEGQVCPDLNQARDTFVVRGLQVGE